MLSRFLCSIVKYFFFKTRIQKNKKNNTVFIIKIEAITKPVHTHTITIKPNKYIIKTQNVLRQ